MTNTGDQFSTSVMKRIEMLGRKETQVQVHDSTIQP